MRIAVGVVLALLAALPAAAQKSPDLLALEGSWAGSYSCGSVSYPVNLTIAQNISYPTGMSATFTFGQDTSDGPKAVGEFFMKVTRIGYNDFSFEPTQWAYRPDGYEWFSMRGQAGNGGISGTIQHPACSSFRVLPAER